MPASSRSIIVDSVGIPGAAVAVTVAVALLFAGTGSVSVAVTLAVFAIVPPTTGAVTTSATVIELPEASAPAEHVTVAVPVQVPCDGVADTNVVPAGSTSATVTPVAPLGPLFVTVIVYAMFAPPATAAAAAVFVIARAAVATPVAVAVEELFAGFASAVALTAAVLDTVAPMPLPAARTSVNVLEAADASVAAEQVIVPVPPTAGVVQVKPAGAVSDWNVIPAGIVSVTCTVDAASGPLFVTTIV